MLLEYEWKSKALEKKKAPNIPEEEQRRLMYGTRGVWHTLTMRNYCSLGPEIANTMTKKTEAEPQNRPRHLCHLDIWQSSHCRVKGWLFKTRYGGKLFIGKKVKFLAHSYKNQFHVKTFSLIKFKIYYLTNNTMKATIYLEYIIHITKGLV